MSEAEEVPVQPGDVLAGKYRVERILGVGGMGAVVAAIHMELDQRVALKFLLPSVADKPEVVSRFAREARAAAKIRSEHVARVTDVGNLESGTPYIVMEYLEGRDLDAIVTDDGPLPIQVAVDYVLQACVAIAEAHAAGIVHRDLKPANFFLARQNDGSAIIKVLDFGISKSLGTGPGTSKSDSLTKTTDVFGSPLYMSPEQLKASRNVDVRADQWALGVILFELISGQLPFDRGTVAEIFGAILHEAPYRLSDVIQNAPPVLEQVILRCLEKDPDKRFANVGELAQALAPFGSVESQVSLQRIARVMQNVGGPPSIAPPSIAPPSMGRVSVGSSARVSGFTPDAAAGTNMTAHPGGSTRTAWGAQAGAPKQRSFNPALAALVVVMSGILAAAVFFLIRQDPGTLPTVPAAEPPHPSATAAPPAPSATAAPPAPSATAAPPASSAAETPPAPSTSAEPEPPVIDPLFLELVDPTASSITPLAPSAPVRVFKPRPKASGTLPPKASGTLPKKPPTKTFKAAP